MAFLFLIVLHLFVENFAFIIPTLSIRYKFLVCIIISITHQNSNLMQQNIYHLFNLKTSSTLIRIYF